MDRIFLFFTMFHNLFSIIGHFRYIFATLDTDPYHYSGGGGGGLLIHLVTWLS